MMYHTISEITDFGPCVTKILLSSPENVKEGDITSDAFNVYVEKKDPKTGKVIEIRKSFESSEMVAQKGYCDIVQAYPSDKSGNRLPIGEFIALELLYGPHIPLTSELSYVHPINIYAQSDFRITQIKDIKTLSGTVSGLIYNVCESKTNLQTKGWVNNISTYPQIPLRYGFYKPEQKKNEYPLIIWLHGAGEGGDNPTLAYTGNKVVNLSSNKIQDIFGGAYVLAPQAPTMWMDNGSGEYTRTGKSMYAASLKYLIDEFILLHPDIDKKRVYIGGCSNGGFMTMRMIIDYPQFFAGAYPVCEALFNECISDDDIAKIKNTPIWFTHTKNDPVVKPEETVLPTYERLKKVQAGNVHLSYFDNCTDISGKYRDSLGNPYEYHGHFSWIYTLNNDCFLDFDSQAVKVNGKKVSLFEWLSMQSL